MPLAVALGLLIGLCLGLLGGGGAVLTVPVLVYVFDVPVHAAATGALIVVCTGATVGAIGHARAGTVCWRHVRWFLPAACLSALAGTLASAAVSGSALLLCIAALMAGAAVATWTRAVDESDLPARACPDIRPLPTALAGVGAGLLTGFSGVGGGFLLVPTFALVLGVPMRRAIATSLVVIAAVSGVALAGHLLIGGPRALPTVAALTLAASAGASFGARLSRRVPARLLGRGFALMLACVAIWVVLDMALAGGPPHS